MKASAPSMWWSTRNSRRPAWVWRATSRAVALKRTRSRRRAGTGVAQRGQRRRRIGGRVRCLAPPEIGLHLLPHQPAEPAQIATRRHPIERIPPVIVEQLARVHVLGVGELEVGRPRHPARELQPVQETVDHQPAGGMGQRRRQRQMRHHVVPALDPDQRHGKAAGERAIAHARAREHHRTPHRDVALVQPPCRQRGERPAGAVAGDVERLPLRAVVEGRLTQVPHRGVDLTAEAAMDAVAAEVGQLVVEVGGPAAEHGPEVGIAGWPGLRAAEDEIHRPLVRDGEAPERRRREGVGTCPLGNGQGRHRIAGIGRPGEAGQMLGKIEVHDRPISPRAGPLPRVGTRKAAGRRCRPPLAFATFASRRRSQGWMSPNAPTT